MTGKAIANWIGRFSSPVKIGKQATSGTPIEACASLDALTDLAESILPAAEKSALQAHLRVCPECAAAAIDIGRLSAGVKRLHAGWFGFLGAWRYAAAKGEPETDESRAWQAHIQKCARCRSRSVLLARFRGDLSASSRSAARSMLTFAAGVAAAVVVMSIMPVLQSPPAGRTSHVKSMPGTPEIVAKSAPLPEPGPASPAQRMLDRFLRPSPRQLPAVIRYWEHEKQADPEDKAVWTKLASLYGLAADCAADPADQAGWRTKQEEAAEWLRQHPN